jgi:hypothetical protein
MTAAQYKTIIAKFGLSQEAAGVWLGVSDRTGQRYAEKGPSEMAARILRLMIRLEIPPEELR